jgi:GNAT superfamily N-acetyltransferase
VLCDAFRDYPVMRARYEAFGAATQSYAVAAPHHHLNMIGVRRSHAGRGLARLLLYHVHALAEADAGSAGVTLSTATPGETCRCTGMSATLSSETRYSGPSARPGCSTGPAAEQAVRPGEASPPLRCRLKWDRLWLRLGRIQSA